MDVKVVKLADGEKVDLANNSWSCPLITGESVGVKKAMLGLSTFTPGTDLPQMIHEEEELCYVLKGSGSITVNDEEVPFDAPCALFIPPGVPHGVRNNGSEDVVMVYVFSYPSYPPTEKA
jgi:mannose-6-phosphate isomerase-like protein (cupin superfamily)